MFGRITGRLALVAVLVFAETSAQSNYGSQANNIEYIGDGLPEQTVLDGKVTKLDDLSPVIFLNRTKAALNCAAGSMQVELKFNDKFFGIAYADFDRNSACQVVGKGALSYKLELPLKGCGTRQEPLRVFTNNIVVRFHPGLEMDGDEVITIVCRYPPPITPIPAALPAPIQVVPPVAPLEPPLKGLHILLIICAIMFLTLLLLGLGVSYLCLRRRTIPALARLPYSEKSGSEITKLSGSSIGNLSAFEGVKIPRAHPALMAAPSSSGSEAPLATASDTLPSDYPSESPSEAEVPVGVDNRAYISEFESYVERTEVQTANALAMGLPPPAFDVQVRVKRAPPPPPSPPPSTTTVTDGESVRGERNLTTIEEQFEESVRTLSPMPPPTSRQAMQALQAPPHPPRRPQHPHYAKVHRDRVVQDWDGSEIAIAPPRRPRSLSSFHTEMTDTHSITEMLDDTHNKLVSLHKKAPAPQPMMMEREEYQMDQMESLEIMPETPILPARKPEITSHVVDDVFLRTITEKKTIEDIERHRRLVTEYRAAGKPLPPDITWDVTIRNHPPSEPQWENFSDVSSVSGITLTPKSERHPLSLPPQNYIGQPGPHLFSPELVGHIRPGMLLLPELPPARNPLYRDDDFDLGHLAPAEPVPQNWNTLTRVLKREHQEEALQDMESMETLTREERARWSKIITTESSLRTMLSRANSREEFERIRTDDRFKGLFPPIKWDVIIRILAPPANDDKPKGGRYRKKSDFDSRSRRSSLPTLYEYDSDGGSSIRTLTNRPMTTTSRKTSRSSYKSDHVDMRSMSEMMVDYVARTERGDDHSEASGGHIRYYADDSDSEHGFRIPRSWSQRSLQRSLSQPSLARSGSEFTERWVLPSVALLPHSPETTPTMPRRDNAMATDRQDMSGYTSSEVRTFQSNSKQSWRK